GQPRHHSGYRALGRGARHHPAFAALNQSGARRRDRTAARAGDGAGGRSLHGRRSCQGRRTGGGWCIASRCDLGAPQQSVSYPCAEGPFLMNVRLDNDRTIRAPRGSEISARSWLTEAPLRMLMNNLDPEVAERPSELVVYGGIGRAARDWESFDRIVASLKRLGGDQALLVQSGKTGGIFPPPQDAPPVPTANPNPAPGLAAWEALP